MRFECYNLNKRQLQKKGLIEVSSEEPCVMCGLVTRYIDFYSESRVCSEECYSEWDKILEDAMKGVEFA